MRPLYSAEDEFRLHRLESSGQIPGEDRSSFRRDCDRLLHSAAFRRLQGKTQVFGVTETDFFRNRLTHSLEVAQIGKAISRIINNSGLLPSEVGLLDLDLIEYACLAHDLGHPPFGHSGEEVLNARMAEFGECFEGNAQTLRILGVLEKREQPGSGLNSTVRSLGSVIKYDSVVSPVAGGTKLAKGYYPSEKGMVDVIKEKVCPGMHSGEFKTVEAQIMDCADDIAYVSCDIEDSFKSGFIQPLDLLTSDRHQMEDVARRVTKNMRKEFGPSHRDYDAYSISTVLHEFYELHLLRQEVLDGRPPLVSAAIIFQASKKTASNGFERKKFVSNLVKYFLSGIQFELNLDCPALSKVSIREDVRLHLEILKNFIFVKIISSPEMKMEFKQAEEVIGYLFAVLSAPGGDQLIPDDYSRHYGPDSGVNPVRRVCDFIAGMTNRYALEFYSRLRTNTVSIFRPL